MEQEIYAGDSSNVKNRVRQHCNSNIEASSFREHIAKEKGYEIIKTKRHGGSTRKRLQGLNCEISISSSIKGMELRYLICSSISEAKEFQWYVIYRLNPLLNIKRKAWNINNEMHYQFLFNLLINSPRISYEQINRILPGPGVYIFYR